MSNCERSARNRSNVEDRFARTNVCGQRSYSSIDWINWTKKCWVKISTFVTAPFSYNLYKMLPANECTIIMSCAVGSYVILIDFNGTFVYASTVPMCLL